MGDVTNPNAWEPVEAEVVSCMNDRSADQLMKVIAGFGVEQNPRYRAHDGSTYCSTFVWDVTRALNAEIPHWWVGHEQNANVLSDWLVGHGVAYGWERCTADEASSHAGEGRPAVAVWKNPGGTGHIAMVIPTPEGATGAFIAQAGARNFVGEAIARGFGTHAPSFFRHP